MRFTFTPDAQSDLNDIAAYLQSLPQAPALRIGKEVQQAMRTIRQFPDLGKLDDLLSKESSIKVLRFVAGKYILFYYVAGDYVRIVGVLHGKRDLDAIMSRRLH